jgi:hypothetical protein
MQRRLIRQGQAQHLSVDRYSWVNINQQHRICQGQLKTVQQSTKTVGEMYFYKA